MFMPPKISKKPIDVLMDTFSSVRTPHLSQKRKPGELQETLSQFFFVQYAGSIHIHYNKDYSAQDGIRYDGYFLHADGKVFKVTHEYVKDSPETMSLISGIPPIKYITAGENFALFLDYEGKVWLRDEGYIFNEGTDCARNRSLLGHKDPSLIPIKIEGIPPIKYVVACAHHCLLLDEKGNVWVFGSNSNYQLGIYDDNEDSDEDFETIYKPTKLVGLQNISHISTEPKFSLFFDLKSVFCCGFSGDSGFTSIADKKISQSSLRKPTLVPDNQLKKLNQKKIYTDPNGNIWTVTGFGWSYHHSKNILLRTLHSSKVDLNVEFPQAMFLISAISKSTYPALIEGFNAEILRYEQMLIEVVIKDITIDMDYISTVQHLAQSKWRYFNHLGLFIRPILNFNANTLKSLIDDLNNQLKSNNNYFIAAFIQLLELYCYLVTNHEKDNKIISNDQTQRVEDFSELLNTLSNKSVSDVTQIESYLKNTAENRELVSKNFNLMLFTVKIPHISTQYYDLRQKLSVAPFNQADAIEQLQVVAGIFVEAIKKAQLDKNADNHKLIECLKTTLEKQATISIQPKMVKLS